MTRLGLVVALMALCVGMYSEAILGGRTKPGMEQGAAPPGLVESTMKIDELYRQLLKTQEGLEAVWKQQPGNIAALKKYTEQMRKQTAALSETMGKREPMSTPSPSGNSKSGASVTKPPSGPVAPSQKPSHEEDIERQREATLGKFLSAGPFADRQESRSLAGVPDTWIQKSARIVTRELTSLDGLLEAQPSDQAAVENSMMRLWTILDRMGNPPQAAPPVTPKDPR